MAQEELDRQDEEECLKKLTEETLTLVAAKSLKHAETVPLVTQTEKKELSKSTSLPNKKKKETAGGGCSQQ